ncbi:hypothetical protein HC031_17095 [Planosporangium thailandense]|uniref:Uncharacterized protein n=1 Tax=Planosporangium thailandense TaxID=765197 RepID=A0ABX0Y1W5_9ACTN|nr:hypothetical protein [Planosporangium thailandense]NJC71420.1 hypothetical protein [Planosporangium thailandense]
MTRVEILRDTSKFPPPGAAVPGAPPALDSDPPTATVRPAPSPTPAAPVDSATPEPAGGAALPVDLSDPRVLYGVSGVLVAAAGIVEYWGRRHFRAVRR